MVDISKYKAFTMKWFWIVMVSIMFMQGLVFPMLEEIIGSFVFLIFVVWNFVIGVYFYFRMVETRNVASADIFELFEDRKLI